ncbi:STAS domain-containing protein [Methylomonas sp. LL1]|uniref:STAS domain-containing protein n=1 Tax=Methylomonas sp. LL1 TaxID=2785785 RepID=UPI0018C38B9B|nr:STAS domain-containing protein [Methylomonas sp. LL1]QPK62443.1 STAS domain-containing protein [Methylomonas sp. LL1]
MQTLAIDGELTIFTAAKRKPHLLEFLKSADELELNLAAVTEIDTAGLQLLILLKREAARAGKSLSFVMHSNAVLETLELANLTSSFGDQVMLTRGQE